MVTTNQATQTEPETAELVNMFCPIHNVCEQEFVSKNGWGNGVKCPWGECLLFTFMEVVHRQLHQELSKQNWKQLACFCDRPMRLRMSHSANNHKHSHVDCNKKDSNFFQCADSPLNPKNGTWVDPIPVSSSLQDKRGPPLNPVKECSGKKLFAEPNRVDSEDHTREDVEHITVVDSTNEIVFPPELRGRIFNPELADQYIQELRESSRRTLTVLACFELCFAYLNCYVIKNIV